MRLWRHGVELEATITRAHSIHEPRREIRYRVVGYLRCYGYHPNNVIGVVERFGKYVLGTKGWRAEIVVIRKLRAPSTEIGLKLERAYPEVEVYYEDR